jgi:protein involved in polysaccharide export with SLBB domain
MIKLKTIKPISVLMIYLLIYSQLLSVHEFTFASEINSQSELSEEGSSPTEVKAQQVSRSPFVPGDGIFINTFPDTSSLLNGYFAIDDMGMIDLPLTGRIKVTDKSTDELESLLKSKFQNYLRSPNLSVKPLMRVSILGGVRTPGLYYVDNRSSLWELVRKAGGTTLEGGLKDMRWERDGEVIQDDLIPYLQTGRSFESMGTKSGDQFWTPITKITFWDTFSTTILPIMTFGASIVMFYYTFQSTVILSRTSRR